MLSKQSGDGVDAEEGDYGYGMWKVEFIRGEQYRYVEYIRKRWVNN